MTGFPVVASVGLVAASFLPFTGLMAPIWQLSGVDDHSLIVDGHSGVDSTLWAAFPGPARVRPHQLVATSEVGYLGFARQDLRVMDLAGLADRAIGQHPPSVVKDSQDVFDAVDIHELPRGRGSSGSVRRTSSRSGRGRRRIAPVGHIGVARPVAEVGVGSVVARVAAPPRGHRLRRRRDGQGPPFLQDVAGTGTASMTITGTAYRYLVSESIELVEPGRQVNVTLWFYDFDKAPAITPPG